MCENTHLNYASIIDIIKDFVIEKEKYIMPAERKY